MADQYLVAVGFVQKFKDKPAVNVREANGQTVRDFTIKTVSQKLVRITVWPENNAPEIHEGDFIGAEGKYSTSGDNNQFHNVSAFRLIVNGQLCQRKEREVVNQSSGDSGSSASTSSGSGEVSAPF